MTDARAGRVRRAILLPRPVAFMLASEPSPDRDGPVAIPHGRDVLGNVRRNLRRLMTGKAFSALLQLAATLLTARTLSATEFGLVVLLQSYVLVWSGLFNFKPFESIIRYGVPALDRGDEAQLLRLLKLGFVVDAVTAVGSAIMAWALAGIVGGFLGWDADFVHLAQLYSLVLVVDLTGTSKGILRLYNRFDVLSVQMAVAPIVLCIGASMAWLKGWGMPAFCAIWALGTLLDRVYLLVRAFGELHARIPHADLRRLELGDWQREFPGIASFTHVVYWQSNLDLVPKQISNLLVGMLLGPQAAGLFRLAVGMAKVLSTPAMLLRQVLFPDLTRVWTRGEAGFYRILATTAAAAAACGLLLVAVMLSYGAQLLDLLAGAEYAAGAGVMAWLLFAGTLNLCSSVLRAAAYVMGRAGHVLRINIAATLVYVAAMMLLTPRLGLVGPGVAACCSALLTLGGMLWLVARHPRMQGVVRA